MVKIFNHKWVRWAWYNVTIILFIVYLCNIYPPFFNSWAFELFLTFMFISGVCIPTITHMKRIHKDWH